MEEPRKDESSENPAGDGQVFNWRMVLVFAALIAAAVALGLVVP